LIYAGLAILVRLPVFMGELSLTMTFLPRDRHVHEMLYSFLLACSMPQRRILALLRAMGRSILDSRSRAYSDRGPS
jgi:hypothetical protein